MKVPASITYTETPTYREIVIKTFDSSLLTFQLTLILIPFLLIEILLIEPDTFLSAFIFVLGCLLTIYWIFRNIKGEYRILFYDDHIEFRRGWPPQIKKIQTDEIVTVKVRRRTGKVSRGGRIMHTTTGPNVDDYYIITKNGETTLIHLLPEKKKNL